MSSSSPNSSTSTDLSSTQQAHKNAMEALLSSTESDIYLSADLIQQYKNSKNPYLIDYIDAPRLARGLAVLCRGENLLTLAVYNEDIPCIKKLIAQPVYQENKSPAPGSTYLSNCSCKVFDLLYNEVFYVKEDLQNSIFFNSQSYAFQNLSFLFKEGYKLPLLDLLDRTYRVETEDEKEYVDFFRLVAKNQVLDMDSVFISGLEEKLELTLEMKKTLSSTVVSAFYSNCFLACVMIVSSTLLEQSKERYRNEGEKLKEKILYIANQKRNYDQGEYGFEAEIEAEFLNYKNQYLIEIERATLGRNTNDFLEKDLLNEPTLKLEGSSTIKINKI